MMWIEAVLASMLLLVAMLLLSQPPPPAPVLLDHLAIWQLEDRSALLAEFGSDAGLEAPATSATLSDDDLTRLIFNQSEPFCYQWAWLKEGNNFDPDAASFSFSENGCGPFFDSHPPVVRSLRRGVWREGSLQFLYVEQAPPSP